jgi:3-oxoacyl-[acyl-carrier-protein] synthase II
MRVISRGHADVCLSGGAECKLNPMGILRQQFAGRLAKLEPEDDPAFLVRPFSEEARGSVLGEGGGILILEALDSARERGAKPLAEIAGFSASQAACSDTVGLVYDEDDSSVELAIRRALDSADCTPADIDAVLPLGSGIPHMDAVDTRAIRAVFGERAGSVPIITCIPNVGLCGAGTGAIATALAAKCLAEQMLPARIGIEGVSTSGLDAGPTAARAAELGAILVFTTSMGGQNTAMVLRRYDNGGENS